MAENVVDFTPPLSDVGLQLGRESFRSFLLAGERVVTAGLEREGTDEARAADLIRSLPKSTREAAEAYFRRQANLALPQRAQVLGNLTNLRIDEALTFESIMKPFVGSPVARSDLATIFPRALPFRIPNVPNVDPIAPLAPTDRRLKLRLERVRVNEAQDDYWFLGSRNTTDEVSLSIIGIDETGDVRSFTHDLGSIGESSEKSFGNKVLYSFDTGEGGRTYPKAFTCQLIAVERDDGGWNDAIREATEYVRSKSQEILQTIIKQGAAKAGIPLPDPIAKWLASFLDGFFKSFVDWLSGILHNDDDVLGQTSSAVVLSKETLTFASGKAQSESYNAVIAGADGRWTIRYHWLLERSEEPESRSWLGNLVGSIQ